jgi:hypothetical protein
MTSSGCPRSTASSARCRRTTVRPHRTPGRTSFRAPGDRPRFARVLPSGPRRRVRRLPRSQDRRSGIQ